MRRLLFRQLSFLLLTLLAASVLIFVALELLPGNAAQSLMGPDAPPEAVAALAQQLGLDQPAPVRWLQWLGGLLRGDLGDSYAYSTPVAGLIGERMAVTLPLALLAMGVATLLALGAGIYAAGRHNSVGDFCIMLLTQAGMAIPGFWLAIVLILVFAVRLHWFAAGGFPGWDDPLAALRALVLPALALALVQAAVLARITRTALLEVLHEEYLRTAIAKGLSRRSALWRHALRNALIPVLTVMGMQFASLLAGTIVIENVFYLPGIGRLVLQSIANRDTIVLRNCILMLAAMVIVINFLCDWLCTMVDPRLRQRQTQTPA